MSRAAGARPRLVMAVGALGVATSGVFISLSTTSPSTATFFRCVLALPLLCPLAWEERGREGGLPRRRRAAAVAAGVLFAGDALLWAQAIYEVGAGLTAVLVNAQVVIVPLLAKAVDREPLSRIFPITAPLMIGGIVLTSGLFEEGASGHAPGWGTIHAMLAAGCYSGFLLLIRRNGRGGRRVQSYVGVLGTAAALTIVLGTLGGSLTWSPGWAALGWLALTAVGSQVCGWLLVALASSHVSSTAGTALLMLTPVGALALSALVLGEHPAPLQLLGCAVILTSTYAAASRPR